MKALNLLIKPASSLCNLQCRYCFYEDAAQNRMQHCMGLLQEEQMERMVQQVFATVEEGGNVNFAFQGGEPTVAGLPLLRRFVGFVKQYRPANVHISYAIQTNGTLLNETWAEFLKKEHFLVGLSLDGLREVHDKYRLDKNGQGTWKRVLSAKKLLDRYGVENNALCVVTGDCANHPERVYRSLKNLGFRYMQFIACLDPIGQPRGQESWSLTPNDYGRFLCGVFDLWYQDWASGNYHSVRLFEDYVHILLGDAASTCATCGRCGAYLVLEGDGSAYPCDFFALDNWKIGNLETMSVSEMMHSETVEKFLEWGTVKPTECGHCAHRAICNGGCKNDWYTDENGSHNYYCTSFKMLLDYAMPRLLTIAAAEKAARKRYS